MVANNRFGTVMSLVVIAWIGFAYTASAQIPVIQPSPSLGEGFEATDSDISNGTVALGRVALENFETVLRVFERTSSNEWVQVATLPVGEGRPGVIHTVAVYRDMAIASVFTSEEGCFLYVFAQRQGEWQQVQKLPFCTIALALGARFAAIAVRRGPPTPTVVHVFRKQPDDTLELETTLTETNGVGFGFLDLSVAIANDTLLVGTPRLNDRRGAVRVLENVRGTWREVATLTPSGAADSECCFGRQIQTLGHTVLISSVSDAAVSAAYVFERVGQNWYQQARLAGPFIFGFRAFLVDRHRVVLQLQTDTGLVRYLARIGGVDGWTPIAQLGPVLPFFPANTIDATRGFVLSFERGEVFVYDVRALH